MQNMTEQINSVKEYYSKILQSKHDLKTDACCSIDSIPEFVREILSLVDPEILEKFYGCGSPIPFALEGIRVLDLGCGTGRDVYVLSKLAGPSGSVIGVDMSDEQLAVAERHVAPQMKKFGFAFPNVEFKKGYIEDLADLDICDHSVDLVVSNCVINLSPDKDAVFREIFRVLKPGGELYFSDVFAGRRVPGRFRDDPVLLGECLAGAMYLEDFRRLLLRNGCPDYRVCKRQPIAIHNPEIEKRIGMIDFCSLTVRAFKLPELEDRCEDYGQAATYLGTIPYNPHRFELDDHHCFETRKPFLVCGNTAAMLQETRYNKHFCVLGDRSRHYGLFPCSPATSGQPGEGFAGSCC